MQKMNFVTIVKSGTGETYYFAFDDSAQSWWDLLEILVRFSEDPELSFSMDDAMVAFDAAKSRRSCRD